MEVGGGPLEVGGGPDEVGGGPEEVGGSPVVGGSIVGGGILRISIILQIFCSNVTFSGIFNNGGDGSVTLRLRSEREGRRRRARNMN